MDAHQIKTNPDPFEAFGIAQGYRVDNLIFLSGQIGMDTQGQVVGEGDFAAQAEQAFANVKAVLEKAGSSMRKIVKATVYLTDMGDVQKFAEISRRHFGMPFPAETVVEVSALALPGLMVEIDVIALGEGIPRPAIPE